MPGFEDAFERNPKIAGGDLVLRGTRVPLRSVLASLAEGCSFQEILRAFPTLTREQLRDTVGFAASSALKDLLRTASGERELPDARGRLDDDEHERLEAALEEALGRFDDGGSDVPAEEAASPLRGPFR
jgi:uncharacterized protein (DUF433 family)